MPSPRQSPIGVGIVGLSARRGWALRAHLPALRHLQGFELRALTASTAESARQAAEKLDVPRSFATADELAAADDVDLVVVTVKVPHHRQAIQAALAAGKAVLCEWPLANGPDEARELATAATERGLRTFTGLQARSAPTVRYLRDLIAGGEIGEVISTSLIASGGNWGPAFPESGAYILDRANGATMLTIPFGHTLDAMTMVLGNVEKVAAVTATRHREVTDPQTGRIYRPDTADQVVFGGVLSSGAVASIHYRGGTSRATNFHWEINGTNGDLIITGDTGHLQMGEFSIHRAKESDTNPSRLAVPETYFDPALRELRGTPAYNVAATYIQIRRDLTDGTHHVPDFTHATKHHQLLHHIERAAERA
jgi:predicted dehydrogenase